ncbi:C6 transcription factor [Paecilomyces variotii No. 5]|uniref:C6 transcription factor n=1 Tax=Byssochlamys spectabilis (strain No. 5 / NBRC 109023) TaxID=1356009 RepID=V5FH44_BYSSN|nr:C6 transcription factor [Paecilomyces variotii No. 5]
MPVSAAKKENTAVMANVHNAEDAEAVGSPASIHPDLLGPVQSSSSLVSGSQNNDRVVRRLSAQLPPSSPASQTRENGLMLASTGSVSLLEDYREPSPAPILHSSMNNASSCDKNAVSRPLNSLSPQNGNASVSSDREGRGAVEGLEGFFGDSSTFTFVSKVESDVSGSNAVQTRNDDQVAAAASHSSSPYIVDMESIYQLPERRLADSLVDGYFDRVHPLYPFLHEGSFRVEYETMWTYPAGTRLRPSWYALFNIVCALGFEFCDTVPEDHIARTVSPFVDRSRDIILSHIYRRGNLEFIQALLLMCHYLQGTLELNECWNLVGLMIRTALSIGLHLNPDNLSLSTVEKEVRKRVWWGCFIIDRTLSMKFGRPPALQVADAQNVPFPAAIDDQYIIQHGTSSLRQPLGRPAIIEFFLRTITLSKVINDILTHLYTPAVKTDSGPSLLGVSEQSNLLSTVVRLNGELQTWWNDGPQYLRQQSMEAEGQVFERQRAVLRIRYLQIRILLQRPLLPLFSRYDIEDDFLRDVTIAGCRACVRAAHETLRMISEKYHRRLLNSLWYNLHYVFTSMGVLLHIRTMRKTKQEILGLEGLQEEIESMNLGMKFLEVASRTSNLAARYVSVLRRIIDKETPRRTNDDQDAAAQVMAPGPEAPLPLQQGRDQGQTQFEELDFAHQIGGLDAWNLDDWLLGTGLPPNIHFLGNASGEFLL